MSLITVNILTQNITNTGLV